MKTRPELVVHGVIAIIWVSLALGICVKIALLGNEEANLGKQRGADFRTRNELAFTADRLRAVLDQETRPATLEQAMRQLSQPAAAAVAADVAVEHPPIHR
jgi:hypothetical protein